MPDSDIFSNKKANTVQAGKSNEGKNKIYHNDNSAEIILEIPKNNDNRNSSEIRLEIPSNDNRNDNQQTNVDQPTNEVSPQQDEQQPTQNVEQPTQEVEQPIRVENQQDTSIYNHALSTFINNGDYLKSISSYPDLIANNKDNSEGVSPIGVPDENGDLKIEKVANPIAPIINDSINIIQAHLNRNILQEQNDQTSNKLLDALKISTAFSAAYTKENPISGFFVSIGNSLIKTVVDAAHSIESFAYNVIPTDINLLPKEISERAYKNIMKSDLPDDVKSKAISQLNPILSLKGGHEGLMSYQEDYEKRRAEVEKYNTIIANKLGSIYSFTEGVIGFVPYAIPSYFGMSIANGMMNTAEKHGYSQSQKYLVGATGYLGAMLFTAGIAKGSALMAKGVKKIPGVQKAIDYVGLKTTNELLGEIPKKESQIVEGFMKGLTKKQIYEQLQLSTKKRLANIVADNLVAGFDMGAMIALTSPVETTAKVAIGDKDYQVQGKKKDIDSSVNKWLAAMYAGIDVLTKDAPKTFEESFFTGIFMHNFGVFKPKGSFYIVGDEIFDDKTKADEFIQKNPNQKVEKVYNWGYKGAKIQNKQFINAVLGQVQTNINNVLTIEKATKDHVDLVDSKINGLKVSYDDSESMDTDIDDTPKVIDSETMREIMLSEIKLTHLTKSLLDDMIINNTIAGNDLKAYVDIITDKNVKEIVQAKIALAQGKYNSIKQEIGKGRITKNIDAKINAIASSEIQLEFNKQYLNYINDELLNLEIKFKGNEKGAYNFDDIYQHKYLSLQKEFIEDNIKSNEKDISDYRDNKRSAIVYQNRMQEIANDKARSILIDKMNMESYIENYEKIFQDNVVKANEEMIEDLKLYERLYKEINGVDVDFSEYTDNIKNNRKVYTNNILKVQIEELKLKLYLKRKFKADKEREEDERIKKLEYKEQKKEDKKDKDKKDKDKKETITIQTQSSTGQQSGQNTGQQTQTQTQTSSNTREGTIITTFGDLHDEMNKLGVKPTYTIDELINGKQSAVELRDIREQDKKKLEYEKFRRNQVALIYTADPYLFEKKKELFKSLEGTLGNKLSDFGDKLKISTQKYVGKVIDDISNYFTANLDDEASPLSVFVTISDDSYPLRVINVLIGNIKNNKYLSPAEKIEAIKSLNDLRKILVSKKDEIKKRRELLEADMPYQGKNVNKLNDLITDIANLYLTKKTENGFKGLNVKSVNKIIKRYKDLKEVMSKDPEQKKILESAFEKDQYINEFFKELNDYRKKIEEQSKNDKQKEEEEKYQAELAAIEFQKKQRLENEAKVIKESKEKYNTKKDNKIRERFTALLEKNKDVLPDDYRNIEYSVENIIKDINENNYSKKDIDSYYNELEQTTIPQWKMEIDREYIENSIKNNNDVQSRELRDKLMYELSLYNSLNEQEVLNFKKEIEKIVIENKGYIFSEREVKDKVVNFSIALEEYVRGASLEEDITDDKEQQQEETLDKEKQELLEREKEKAELKKKTERFIKRNKKKYNDEFDNDMRNKLTTLIEDNYKFFLEPELNVSYNVELQIQKINLDKKNYKADEITIKKYLIEKFFKNTISWIENTLKPEYYKLHPKEYFEDNKEVLGLNKKQQIHEQLYNNKELKKLYERLNPGHFNYHHEKSTYENFIDGLKSQLTKEGDLNKEKINAIFKNLSHEARILELIFSDVNKLNSNDRDAISDYLNGKLKKSLEIFNSLTNEFPTDATREKHELNSVSLAFAFRTKQIMEYFEKLRRDNPDKVEIYDKFIEYRIGLAKKILAKYNKINPKKATVEKVEPPKENLKKLETTENATLIKSDKKPIIENLDKMTNKSLGSFMTVIKDIFPDATEFEQKIKERYNQGTLKNSLSDNDIKELKKVLMNAYEKNDKKLLNLAINTFKKPC